MLQISMEVQLYIMLPLKVTKRWCKLLILNMSPETINTAGKNDGNTALHAAALGGA